MCRGIPEDEVKRIQYGLYANDGMFYLSRLYVPFSLFRMYRLGIFHESFSFMELKYILRIVVVMQLLDLTGHAMLKYSTREIVGRHVGQNELGYAYNKKKLMDDYLIQKNYFKTKKEAKGGDNNL
ncbi:hypothetical protein FGO68_gene2353 [Halteria grandinella]|uniref:Uncharacterized protein n=1 Tax=Halteria grandinella TaxID=5974 RepID=A0A8J8NDS1_HALGN|nr:hypothetical protein FGO68_gene2353 [Halteria grandinella]